MSSEEFCSRLDTFFSQLPKNFNYAVEIRNVGPLGPDYQQVLDRHGVAHVYNHSVIRSGNAAVESQSAVPRSAPTGNSPS
jgi:hypothetical protein